MKLHSWHVNCPTCKQNATMIDLKFSQQGDVHMDLICIACNIPLIFDSSWEKIVISCAEWDNQKLLPLMEVSASLQ